MSTDSVLLTATVDAYDGLNAGICNIPDDFFTSEMYKDMKMAICVRLVELTVNISPQIYRQHVIYKYGRPVL